MASNPYSSFLENTDALVTGQKKVFILNKGSGYTNNSRVSDLLSSANESRTNSTAKQLAIPQFTGKKSYETSNLLSNEKVVNKKMIHNI